MLLEIPRENISTLLEKTASLSSAELAEKVKQAWKIQQERFAGSPIQTNASMRAKDIEEFIHLDSASKDFLKQATEKFSLSGRVVHRLLKLARTIADMEARADLQVGDIMEALHYRSKTMFVESE